MVDAKKPMVYRRLGRTNLDVSRISLGTAELGMDYGIPASETSERPSEFEAGSLLNHALNQGINFIDTAPAYGVAEEIIGKALKSRRGEYILATKVDPRSQVHLPERELRRVMQDSIADSLKKLQTDVIDLLYVHSATEEVIRRQDVLKILVDAREKGDVRFIGATTYGEAAAVAVLEDGGYDCLQVEYNLLDRMAESRVLSLAEKKDVGLVVRSVLLKGALTHRNEHLPAHLLKLREAVQALMSIAGKSGLDVPRLAYRYVLSNSRVASALVGTGTKRELDEVLDCLHEGPIPRSVLDEILGVQIESREQLNPSSWGID